MKLTVETMILIDTPHSSTTDDTKVQDREGKMTLVTAARIFNSIIYCSLKNGKRMLPRVLVRKILKPNRYDEA